MARASSHAEDVIKKGSEELDRRSNLLMAPWKGLDRKNKLWKVERERCEHGVSKREQQLATREAELTRKAESLDRCRQSSQAGRRITGHSAAGELHGFDANEDARGEGGASLTG